MERSLKIFRKIENEGGGMDEIRSSIAWTELERELIEVDSVIEDSETQNIIVDLFVMVDGNETFVGNNTFYVVCNDTWLRVIQNRCEVRIVVPFNFSTDSRQATISFFHNADSDIVKNVFIYQNGHEYSVNISCLDENVIEQEDNIKVVKLNSLANSLSKETIKFYVECVGGNNDFKLRKPKKFTIVEGAEENETMTMVSNYDNAFELIKFNDKENNLVGFDLVNYGNINCNYELIEGQEESDNKLKSLITDDYFYEITVNHINDVDATDTIRVVYEAEEGTNINEKPVRKVKINKPTQTEPFVNLYEKIENGDSESMEASVMCNVSELWFSSDAETKTVYVETVPEDSSIYFISGGTFIESAVVNGHEIEITVKKNPFTTERACLCNIINAEYQNALYQLFVKQEGNGTK